MGERYPRSASRVPTLCFAHISLGERMLAEGTNAPDFAALDHDGNPVRLSDLRGGWVLLWWYPKADTPG